MEEPFLKSWKIVSKLLVPPHNEKEYENLVVVLDLLLDTNGIMDEEHPLGSLLEVVGILIHDYEEIHHII